MPKRIWAAPKDWAGGRNWQYQKNNRDGFKTEYVRADIAKEILDELNSHARLSGLDVYKMEDFENG